MAYSPACLLNGASSINGLNATAGSTVTISLASGPASPIWSIACTSTDDTLNAATITAGLTINQTTKVATFTAPVAASALIFTSTVNNGIDPITQRPDPNLITTFAVYVLTDGGNRVIAANEVNEGNANFGWTASINPLIRGNGGSSTLPIFFASQIGS